MAILNTSCSIPWRAAPSPKKVRHYIIGAFVFFGKSQSGAGSDLRAYDTMTAKK